MHAWRRRQLETQHNRKETPRRSPHGRCTTFANSGAALSLQKSMRHNSIARSSAAWATKIRIFKPFFQSVELNSADDRPEGGFVGRLENMGLWVFLIGAMGRGDLG